MSEAGYSADSAPVVVLLKGFIDEDLPTWKDVVRAIAVGVEKALLEELRVLGDTGLPQGAPPEHVRHVGRQQLSTHEMEAQNALQMTAERQRFAGASGWSFATDGARIGFRSRQNTLWVLPDNAAAWGPPVVTP